MKKRLYWLYFFCHSYINRLTCRQLKQLGRHLFCRFILMKPAPLSCVLQITYRCQCRCPFCFLETADLKKEPDMDKGSARTFLDKLTASGCFNVTFSGGEPLLHNDIVELVNYASSRGLRVSLDTNGIALSPALALELKLAGLANINVSLDDREAVIHDGYRGSEGSFASAVRAIEICRNNGIACFISTRLTPRLLTTDHLKNLYDFAFAYGVIGIKLLFPRSLDYSLNQEFNKEQHAKLKNAMKELHGIFVETPLWMKTTDIHYCPAANRKLVTITPQGYFQFCPLMPLRVADFNNGSFEDCLWDAWQTEIFSKKDNGCLIINQNFRNKYPHSAKC